MKYLVIDKKQRGDTGENLTIPTGSARLLEELEKKNIESDFIYNDQLEFVFHNGKMEIYAGGKNITEYTHIIFRGHALHNDHEYHYKRYIIDYIDQYNKENTSKKILVQNSEAIKKFPYYNKIAIAQFCSINNIPYFDTYFRTNGDYLSTRSVLSKYPLIIKEYAGVNRIEMIDGKEKVKKNVFKIEKIDDYKQGGLEGQDFRNFFVQEFSDSGEDYRIFVKLGKVIGGWKRLAKNSFMTVSKGEYEMYNEPNDEIRSIAEKVATLLDADFMAVDLMYINGKAKVQEFSLHPGYKAYETKIEGSPVNIAEAIITAFKKENPEALS